MNVLIIDSFQAEWPNLKLNAYLSNTIIIHFSIMVLVLIFYVYEKKNRIHFHFHYKNYTFKNEINKLIKHKVYKVRKKIL